MTRLDLEEILRRELHAAAESIEPAGDGLSQIRARLSAPRPLAIAWLMVGWTSILQPALLRLDQVLVAFGDWLRAIARPVIEPLHPLGDRLWPLIRPALGKVRALFTPRAESGGRPSRYAWVRPALVMAAVVAVAVAGGFALSGLPRQIQQAASSMLSNPAHPTKHGQGSHVAGSAKPYLTPGVSGPSPSPSPSCSPSKHKAKPSPTPTPSTSPSPTPTPSTSPSPTPSASPTPTPSDSASGDDPSTSSSQSADDTSDLVLASTINLNSATAATPSPTCTPSSG